MEKIVSDNPYLLLTPGPLSTSQTVKEAMLRDWCTWDSDYNDFVQQIRKKLAGLATLQKGYSSVLMQGSGTFSVESVIGSTIPNEGCLLILVNGAYGQRIAKIAERLKIDHRIIDFGEVNPIEPEKVEKHLLLHPETTHIAMVHCETTTGMLNDMEPIAHLAKSRDKIFILDAMSSFGGIPFDVHGLGIDFLISSANKCIQGVPGFGFIIARNEAFERCEGLARSLSLDLYDQWKTMEVQNGKWRFTSPTHVVKAFYQALSELEEEGGIEMRYKRYKKNQKILRKGMEELGFECLLPKHLQSPFITSFKYPGSSLFKFDEFYLLLKSKGFVIYPGKITEVNTFRIGNMGEVYEDDVYNLLEAVKGSIYW